MATAASRFADLLRVSVDVVEPVIGARSRDPWLVRGTRILVTCILGEEG
jgi:hypothetical protein